MACGYWARKIQFVAATDVRHISTTDDFETVERNERGEAAIDGAVVAGKTGAAQGTLDDGEGGGGGMAATGIPNQSTMSRTQWQNFKKNLAIKQGR